MFSPSGLPSNSGRGFGPQNYIVLYPEALNRILHSNITILLPAQDQQILFQHAEYLQQNDHRYVRQTYPVRKLRSMWQATIFHRPVPIQKIQMELLRAKWPALYTQIAHITRSTKEEIVNEMEGRMSSVPGMMEFKKKISNMDIVSFRVSHIHSVDVDVGVCVFETSEEQQKKKKYQQILFWSCRYNVIQMNFVLECYLMVIFF